MNAQQTQITLLALENSLASLASEPKFNQDKPFSWHLDNLVSGNNEFLMSALAELQIMSGYINTDTEAWSFWQNFTRIARDTPQSYISWTLFNNISEAQFIDVKHTLTAAKAAGTEQYRHALAKHVATVLMSYGISKRNQPNQNPQFNQGPHFNQYHHDQQPQMNPNLLATDIAQQLNSLVQRAQSLLLQQQGFQPHFGQGFQPNQQQPSNAPWQGQHVNQAPGFQNAQRPAYNPNKHGATQVLNMEFDNLRQSIIGVLSKAKTVMPIESALIAEFNTEIAKVKQYISHPYTSNLFGIALLMVVREELLEKDFTKAPDGNEMLDIITISVHSVMAMLARVRHYLKTEKEVVKITSAALLARLENALDNETLDTNEVLFASIAHAITVNQLPATVNYTNDNGADYW